MSLKDRLESDLSRCFMRTDHFAEVHYWNGYPITCVPDDEEAIKRKNNNVNDISWDNNIRNILLHVPLASMPGGVEPEVNIVVTLDKRRMKILNITNNKGMLGIELTALDPREIS